MRFALATGTPEPIFAQIARQVRIGVARGTLSPGERLPSVRSLARELAVNPNTVQKAYAELERTGIVYTKRGAGTFVAAGRPTAVARREARRRLGAQIEDLLAEAVQSGFTVEEAVAELRKRARRYRLAPSR